MRVTMIGTGYVGLVSGACFADFGHEVCCVDKDVEKIGRLRRGQMPIYEPGLEDLVEQNVKEGRLTFDTSTNEAIKSADAVFIAVGTPTRRGDGHADLTYVYEAAREIAALIEGFTVIVTKSTVPVGTGDEIEKIIRETRPDAEFAVVSNPEFLREGAAINDFKRPDRVVVGTLDERARESIHIHLPQFIGWIVLADQSHRIPLYQYVAKVKDDIHALSIGETQGFARRYHHHVNNSLSPRRLRHPPCSTSTPNFSNRW